MENLKQNERLGIDENIYLKENRFEKPKEIFKKISSIIERENFLDEIKICDVGCSTGEFLFYFKKKFQQSKVFGVDASDSMIKKSKEMVPNGTFLAGDINSPKVLEDNSFDVVTMIGVLSIFDDPEKSIKNCVSAIKDNGMVIIAGIFNTEPIDVIVKYRESDSYKSEMLPGWNVHSCRTIERILNEVSPRLRIQWHDFRMPFEIEKTSDSMRTWTVKMNDEITLVNGASQIVDMKILEIKKE